MILKLKSRLLGEELQEKDGSSCTMQKIQKCSTDRVSKIGGIVKKLEGGHMQNLQGKILFCPRHPDKRVGSNWYALQTVDNLDIKQTQVTDSGQNL